MTLSVIIKIVASLGAAVGLFLVKVVAVFFGVAVVLAVCIGLLIGFLPSRRKEELVRRSS